MKFILIFGPLAVGKMTVGQELEKLTGLKLFHNHMTIEMVLPFFDMKSESFKKLVRSFRLQMFEEVAKSDLDGLIFTYVWELNQKSDCHFIENIATIFEKQGHEMCYVELAADVAERMTRNKSPNRLKHKPSKNDFAASERELLETDKKHIVNSERDEFKQKNHIKIDNTDISADIVAKMIKERFCL
ncbi:MAG: hypothetical protein ACKVIX_02590 [Sphingomonadales bacterium]